MLEGERSAVQRQASSTDNEFRMNVTLLRASLVFCIATFVIAHSSIARADDSDNCAQLEALNQQYLGVELTPAQKKIKVRLVAWYMQHCTKRNLAHR